MSNEGSGDDPKSIPEFAKFLRSMGVQALDNFANRLSRSDVNEENSPKPVRKIAEHWMSLSSDQKNEFVGKILTTAETVAAAAPAALVALKAKRAAKAKQKIAEASEKTARPSAKRQPSDSTKKKSDGKKSAAGSGKPKNSDADDKTSDGKKKKKK